MACLPFSNALYRDLQHQGLDANDLWRDPSRYGRSQRWFRSSEALEDDLRWLINVGVLRREVDGQGLTDRVRLTPMGLMVLEHFHGEILPADLISRCHHWLRRHWPRS